VLLGLHSETSRLTSANMKCITLFLVGWLTGFSVVSAVPTPQEVNEALVRMRELYATPTLEIDAQEAITLLGTVSGMANASLTLDQDGAIITFAEVLSASSPLSYASLHGLHAATLPVAPGDWNIGVHGGFLLLGVLSATRVFFPGAWCSCVLPFLFPHRVSLFRSGPSCSLA